MDWSLVIEKVTLEDDGIFQCQVLHHVIPTIKLTDEYRLYCASQVESTDIENYINPHHYQSFVGDKVSLIRLDLEGSPRQSGRLLPS